MYRVHPVLGGPQQYQDERETIISASSSSSKTTAVNSQKKTLPPNKPPPPLSGSNSGAPSLPKFPLAGAGASTRSVMNNSGTTTSTTEVPHSHHQRAHSEQLHSNNHPSHYYYNQQHQYYYQQQHGLMHHPAAGYYYPPPSQTFTNNYSYSTASETRSGQQQQQQHFPPPYNHRPRSNSLQEQEPLLQQQPEHTRQRSGGERPDSSRHQRSYSYGSAFPNHQHFYGATTSTGASSTSAYTGGGSTPPSSRPPKKAGATTTASPFSPRTEILNSFGSISPRTSPRTASSPKNPSLTNPYTPWPHAPTATTTNSTNATHPLYTNSGSEEAAIFYHKRQDSTIRKKHMRQQSAQLFMESYKGSEQPPACRDIFWLLLFVFHLIAIAYLNRTYGYEAFREEENNDGTSQTTVNVYYHNLLYIASLCGAFAVVLSASLLAIMTAFARKFVQVALIFIIAISFVWGTIGVGVNPKSVVPVTGIIALALSIGYAFIVWDRIPFASANLLTAFAGIKAFPGTLLVAFLFQALTLGAGLIYMVLLFGIYDAVQDGTIEIGSRMAATTYVLIAVSFYWTFQVLLNTVQVVTASIIGEWWFQSEGGAVVKRSSIKTIYYSMGSICFGSLTVGPVKFIRQVSALVRPSSDEASLLCLHECLFFIRSCISGCVDGLSDRFNAGGFTYVGLYSYGFLEASRRVTELFKMRGWTMIASDELVPNILLMFSLVIGGITGCFGYLVAELTDTDILSLNEPGPVSFITGAVVGLALTSVLFGVISSAVNTVLVCFASSPVDLARNHPEISDEMRDAWREVWPGALDAVDLQVVLQL